MQMLRANSCAFLPLVHRLVTSIRNTAVRCYTDRHNTVMTAKGSTLDDKQGFYFSEHGEAGAASPAYLRAVEAERKGVETLTDGQGKT